MALVLVLLLVFLINEANALPRPKERTAAPDKPVGVDRKLSDLPTSKESSVERTAEKPERLDRKLPDLPPPKAERAAEKPERLDRKFPDLPPPKKASVERAAERLDRKFPDLPPPKKASAERAAEKPERLDRKFPDLPPPKKASAERAAEKPERLNMKFPDLPPPKKASVERVVDKPGRELPDWRSAIIDGFYIEQIPDEHLRAAVLSDLKKKWLVEETDYTYTNDKRIHLVKRVDVTSICTTRACMDLMANYAKWKAEHDDGKGVPSGRWG
ncbi:hypothetical protein SNE40_008966 [Patella caerulea]|uniref:Uncharacterized protein n=1 Tax=Patella caerulea TaxID=87958 RepID=A0AAN8PPG9_PATCE